MEKRIAEPETSMSGRERAVTIAAASITTVLTGVMAENVLVISKLTESLTLENEPLRMLVRSGITGVAVVGAVGMGSLSLDFWKMSILGRNYRNLT